MPGPNLKAASAQLSRNSVFLTPIVPTHLALIMGHNPWLAAKSARKKQLNAFPLALFAVGFDFAGRLRNPQLHLLLNICKYPCVLFRVPVSHSPCWEAKVIDEPPGTRGPPFVMPSYWNP